MLLAVQPLCSVAGLIRQNTCDGKFTLDNLGDVQALAAWAGWLHTWGRGVMRDHVSVTVFLLPGACGYITCVY